MYYVTKGDLYYNIATDSWSYFTEGATVFRWRSDAEILAESLGAQIQGVK